MKTILEIVETASVPNRDEKTFIVKIVKGNILRFKHELHSPQIPGSWRVSAMTLGDYWEPNTNVERKNAAVTLTGPEGLAAGMLLVESSKD